ncbi:MAG: RNA 2',3'-cyclic phosphodiesterase [Acidobacteriaceae bacterium]|nr:RNA 2',3'-cyclic phosphodiesterase [Acidobacteriaceae bacterium]
MRLFTGIDLAPEILLRLERLITALRPEALIKWSPLDNLHVTIKFIGEWPESDLDRLHEVLASLPPREPFSVEIRDLGWFPNEGSPRVLWAGIHGGEALESLAQDVEQRLETLGINKEGRVFAPHLTLARIKNPVPLQRLRQKVREMQPAALGHFSVSRFVLFRSEPGSNASIYRRLREYALEPTESALAARNA